MKLDRIELYLVENMFDEPWHTAYGSDDGNCVLITRMISGKHEGWSESSPLPGPNYSYEYGEGIYEIASRFLAPVLIGKELPDYQTVNNYMKHVKGNPFAKAGLEMAWWTLKADMDQVPLRYLLGRQEANVLVDRGEGFGIYDTYDNLIERIGQVIDTGVKRVKLKMAHGWDMEMLAAVRSTFPTQTFHVDCNSSYAPDEIDYLKQLDKFHLAMIEQPFALNDFVSHAKLQKQMDTPICLDEAIVDVISAQQAIALGCCRYVNIKPARVGGLGNSLEINRLCQEAGVGCWIGGMLESDVGKGICAELASIGNMDYPHDISPECGTYPDPLCSVHLDCPTPWTVRCADHPGTPIKPDMEKLASKTIKKVVFDAK